jgi:hypothetical protein
VLGNDPGVTALPDLTVLRDYRQCPFFALRRILSQITGKVIVISLFAQVSNSIRKDIPYPFPLPWPAAFLYQWKKWQKLLEVIFESW